MQYDDAQDIRIVEEGYWRVRLQSGEINRNRQLFRIDDAEYGLARDIVFGILSKVPNPELLRDVKKIRQTRYSWQRFNVDDLRIVYEVKRERDRFSFRRTPVLIWHMLLRKNLRDGDPNWIYDLVQQRQCEVYPEKPRDRKGRLRKDTSYV